MQLLRASHRAVGESRQCCQHPLLCWCSTFTSEGSQTAGQCICVTQSSYHTADCHRSDSFIDPILKMFSHPFSLLESLNVMFLHMNIASD